VRRTANPLSYGTTVLFLVFASYLLYEMRDEAAYWVSSSSPVDLGAARLGGAAKGFHPEREAHNVLARISGIAGKSAERFERFGRRFEIVAIEGTNLVVEREPGGTSSTAVSGRGEILVEGRLLRDDLAPSFYLPVFANLVQRSEVELHRGHVYLLLDGDRPRTGMRTPAVALALVALMLVNLRSIARALFH
jgi:hypothetical protein